MCLRKHKFDYVLFKAFQALGFSLISSLMALNRPHSSLAALNLPALLAVACSGNPISTSSFGNTHFCGVTWCQCHLLWEAFNETPLPRLSWIALTPETSLPSHSSHCLITAFLPASLPCSTLKSLRLHLSHTSVSRF